MTKKNNLIILLFIIIFSLPLLYIGIEDIESYDIYFFKYYNPISLFKNFNINFFLGIEENWLQGIKYFPTIFFIFNIKFFYIFTIISSLFIQCFFFKKILFYYNVKKINIFYYLILIFGISNVGYAYHTDWLDALVTYSLIVPLIYYSIKMQKNKTKDLIKFFSIYLILFLNSHIGLLFLYSTLLIPFLFLNKNYIFLKKKITYFLLLLFVLTISNKFTEVLSLTNEFEYREINSTISNKQFIHGLTIPISICFKIIKNIFQIDNINNSFFLFLDSLKINGREIINSPLIYIVMILSIIFLNQKKYLLKANYNLIFLFFAYIILIYFNILNYFLYFTKFFPAFWIVRDLINLFSIIILTILFTKYVKNKIFKNFILISILFCQLLYLGFSINANKMEYKYFINNFNTKKSFDTFVNKNFDEKDFFRIYLDPEIIKSLQSKKDINKNIRNYFFNNGIYSTYSFSKYNLPLTHLYNYKNLSNKNSFSHLMLNNFDNHKIFARTFFLPRISDIQNQVSSNFLKIKFLLILDKNKRFIDKNLFELSDKIKINETEIIYLYKYKFFNQTLKTNKENINIINNCLFRSYDNCKNSKAEMTNNIIFKKISYDSLSIKNISNNAVKIILPFYYNKNFYLSSSDSSFKTDLTQTSNNFASVNINANTTYFLKYKNTKKSILFIIEILGFCSFLILNFKYPRLLKF